MARRKKNKYAARFHKHKDVNSGHPTYVFDKENNVFYYIGLTHSVKTDGINNILLDKNPNPKDAQPAYIRPQVDSTNSSQLGRVQKDWRFADSDKKKVKNIINEHKKKK